MRWTTWTTILTLVLLGVGPPGAALAGEASFDGQTWGGALAASLADGQGDTLRAARSCRGPGAPQPVDGCGVLVVGDGETRSAIMLPDASCAGGPGCYAGYPVVARADGFEPGPADTELDLFVRIHGGIATSPLGVVVADPSVPPLDLFVRVHGGLGSSPLGIDVEPVETDGVVKVCGGLGSCPLGIADLPRAWVLTHAWLDSLTDP